MIQLTPVTLFFLQCLAGVAWAQTVATDAPGIYQGLYRKPEGGVETLNCGPNSIFATSSTFAGCCSIGGNCNFPTACATGTATNRLGETFTCGQDQQCYTMTVVGNYASPTQSVVVHNCAKEWLATTIYREIPGAATTGTQSSVTSAASPGAPVTSASSPSPSATPPPAASGISDAIESSTDSSEPEPAKRSKTNGGIIAGITIGAVCGLVAAGLVGFWFGRRNGLRARPSPSSEEGSSNPFQLLGPSKGLSSASHIRSATGLTGVSAIGSIPGVPNDPWYGYTFPAPPKSPASGGYPETPYDKSIGHQHQVQINEMEGDSVSIRTAGEKSLTKSAGGGGHFYEHGFGIGPGPTVPSGVYRDSSKARKSWRAGHAELEGEGLGIVPVRENSMI